MSDDSQIRRILELQERFLEQGGDMMPLIQKFGEGNPERESLRIRGANLDALERELEVLLGEHLDE